MTRLDEFLDGMRRRRRALVWALATFAVLLTILLSVGSSGCSTSKVVDSGTIDRPAPAVARTKVAATTGESPAVTVQIPSKPDAATLTALANRSRALPPSTEPIVRVRIGTKVPSTELVFTHPQQFLWVIQPGQGRGVTVPTPVRIAPEGAGWSMTAGSGDDEVERHWLDGMPLEVHPMQGARPSVEWHGIEWPGVMVLSKDKAPARSDMTDLVVRVPMETYLPGVLSKELFAGWKIDTYRAQSVAARSYALIEMDRWADRRHFDVVAGEANQAWVGATTRPEAIQAVADTRGIVLLFDERVVPAYYSSCCGGRGASVNESVSDNPSHAIWPLLSGEHGSRSGEVCCDAAKVRTWKTRITEAEFRSRVRRWGAEAGRKDLALLQSVGSVSRAVENPSGRAVEYAIHETSGRSMRINGEDLRVALNRFAPAGSRDVRSGDFRVLVVNRGGSFDLVGNGFGHGCGLCQYGAQGMAKAGANWKAILNRYYPGAEIRVVW
ncbi:MAG: SpoIID/LytB domain-containing protein [Planctomycetota bacterium]|nr:SpoIID/LytB domain-containing protein [Planctomycetota bacterium]